MRNTSASWMNWMSSSSISCCTREYEYLPGGAMMLAERDERQRVALMCAVYFGCVRVPRPNQSMLGDSLARCMSATNMKRLLLL